MFIGFERAQPVEEHARLVMLWRNDPATLKNSFDQAPKLWNNFWPEFCNSYFSVPRMPPHFALVEGKRVGFLRFRPISDPALPLRRAVELSINIDPQQRGKRLSVPMLRGAITMARQQGFDDVHADIKRENAPSIKAFEKAGFEYLNVTNGVLRYVFRVDRTPTPDKRVFVIAEAGSNWRMGSDKRDLKMAQALIDVAADAGADAVKFQVYRADTVYAPNAGSSDYLADTGIQEDIGEIFSDLAMPYEMISELADHCRKRDIEFMATPFSVADFEAIDPFVQRHKIASYEISHLRLLQKCAEANKPTILSTGASEFNDIDWAVRTYREGAGTALTLMQCTAKYPAPLDTMNLRVLSWLKRTFGVSIGLSDHSRDPVVAPAAAVALGATVIEKHFTLDNRLPGPDHSFAVTPKELSAMVQAIRQTEQTLGTGAKEVQSEEQELASFARRGVQALRDIAVGEAFVEGENISILRPGKQTLGVHPQHLDDLEGKNSQRALRTGEGVRLGDW